MGEAYAIAGVHNTGVFFATLDVLGNVIRRYRWELPTVPGGGFPKKPFIRESPTYQGHFYICGDFDHDAYVIRVDGSTGGLGLATPVWARFYSNNNWMEAYSLIESPYNSGELIVVGRTDLLGPGNRAADGFFMKLNSNDGSVLTHTTYEKQNSGDEWISTIEPAYGTTGGSDGYIIGGRSHFPIVVNVSGNQSYTPWMAKLDRNGGVIWSTLIRPSSYDTTMYSTGDISSVFERQNSSGQYDYYGAANEIYIPPGAGLYESRALLVFKLDDAGSDATYNQDEFHYTSGQAWGSPK